MLSIEGIIVNTAGAKRGRIEIDQASGLIEKVSAPTGLADVVLQDELIFPGFVDLHVHARECADHSQDYKEDFKTAGEAAINGGVVAFAEMPNNPVPPIDDQSYEVKNGLSKKSPVTVLLYAGIGPGTRPLGHNSPTGELKKVPYKVFMGPSVGDLFFTSLDDLKKTLERYKGECVSFHCEDPKILEESIDAPKHELRRPKEAEVSAIDFALQMIEKYGLEGKICHASTCAGIEKIKAAKARGLNVVAEVSPHHLYFNTEMLTEENRNFMQMNPPLRPETDRDYLLEALREGTIDFLATDHAPHTIEEKLKGTSGTPQLDTYGPFTTWLMQEHGFSPQDICRISAENPGSFFNQFQNEKFGKIEKGYVGSLTVIDMSKKFKVEREKLKTKCGWSPFEGFTFPGSVVMTIIKGKILKGKT